MTPQFAICKNFLEWDLMGIQDSKSHFSVPRKMPRNDPADVLGTNLSGILKTIIIIIIYCTFSTDRMG